MPTLDEIEDDMETLDDIDDLAEQVGDENDGSSSIEDDIFNPKFEEAEEALKEEGSDDYYMLDDANFDMMEFESWDEQDVMPPIRDISRRRRKVVETAFGFLPGDALDKIEEMVEWRDIYVSLDLEKTGYEGEELAARLRGYLREASSSVKHLLENDTGLARKVTKHRAVVPSQFTEEQQEIEIEGASEGEEVEIGVTDE